MALPDIEIGSRFDAKGFKQAETASKKLEKNVRSLAKSFVGVFAAQKVLAFGKASVKAFAEDDAAAKSLGQTLKNLGLAYGANVGSVNGFINRLEMQTGILDDELRPALDRILRATGDVTKSQELLSLALDIAAGTGKSVTQVSQSLQKAYLGQTQALGRLGVGLSKAELSSSDFEQIQARLADLFAGQATRAADSYQGSLNKLTVASNNAKETIGKGLVDALGILSNSSTVDPTVSGIDRIANSIANATKSAAKFIAVSKTLFSDMSFFRNDATTAAALAIKQGTRFTIPMTISSQDTQKADKKAADNAKKLAAAKIKADKAAAAAKIKADKAAAAKDLKLKEAAAAFDITKINIAAALKNTYDKDERLRLLAMQAIENDNGEAALKYIEQLNILTKAQQTNKLNGIKGITESELSSINEILLKDLEAIRTSKMSEEDRAKARQEAWNKYNSAISASGGLAEAQFYSEKLQAQNLAVAKIAALDTVSAAQTPLLTLAKSDELDVIKVIQAAQKTADDAKYKALQDYINLIKSVPQVAAIAQTPSGIVSVVPAPGTPAPIVSGGIPIVDIPATNMPTPTPTATGGSMFGYSLPDYIKTGANFAGGPYTPPANVTVNIEGMIDTENFGDVFNRAMLDAIRKGLPQTVAGQIP